MVFAPLMGRECEAAMHLDATSVEYEWRVGDWLKSPLRFAYE
jgi:hypothetical protein